MRTRLMAAVMLAVATLALPGTPATADTSSWSDTPAVPVPPGALGGALRDVTAITSSDVWAIGWWRDSDSHPLTAHWDGTAWADVPVDETARPGHYELMAVDGVAPDDVWAVGSLTPASTGAASAALVMHAGGGGWSIAATIAFATSNAVLNDIDLTSPGSGWAVGQIAASDGTMRALILQGLAGTWVQVPTPQLPVGAQLTSVFAASPSEAWAVGAQRQADGTQITLIVHWDGRAWRTIAAPVNVVGKLLLKRVAGVSGSDVWAVGSGCQPASMLACSALALHLSNGAWQTVPTAGGAELAGIAPQSSTDVWLAGYDAFDETTDTDHVEHWDGKQLLADESMQAVVPLPFNGIASALSAATPDGAGGLWTVGWTQQAGQTMPSALHRQ